MSVIVATKEELQSAFSHLCYIVAQEKKISIKIVKSIDENYKDYLKYLMETKKTPLMEARQNCLFDMLAKYTRVNHVEYALRYKENNIDVEALELESPEEFDKMVESEKEVYQARLKIGSLLYNIGEYVNMPTNSQKLLEDLYNIYINDEEVKKRESELNENYNR